MVNLSDYRASNGYSSIVRVGPRSVLITYNRGPNNGAASHDGAFAVNKTCQVAVLPAGMIANGLKMTRPPDCAE